MQEIGRRWLTLPGNVRGSLIVLLASLISVLMTSLIKHVVRLSMVEKQSAFLTVKYKLHNPSQRRRAMLLVVST